MTVKVLNNLSNVIVAKIPKKCITNSDTDEVLMIMLLKIPIKRSSSFISSESTVVSFLVQLETIMICKYSFLIMRSLQLHFQASNRVLRFRAKINV